MPSKKLSKSFEKIRRKSKRPHNEGVKLTFKCNNNCVFCYDHLRRKQIEEMPLEQAKLKIIQLKNRRNHLISLRGSEPTIYPYIFELIQFINNNGLKFRLTTNARLFSYEDVTKEFVKMGLVQVYTSLHSHKAEVHDSLTNTLGSFGQTAGGIKNLLKYGVSVETNTTIMRQNVGCLKEMAQFLSEEFDKLYRVRFSALYHDGVDIDIKTWREIMPSLSDIRKNLTEAMDILRGNNIYSFIEKLPVCGAPKYHLDFKPENYVIQVNKKPSVCVQCKYFNNNYCVGVNPVYLELYGEKDLIPQ